MTRVHQKDFSAQQSEAQAAPRLPCTHGDEERSEGAGLASGQGPQAPDRLRADILRSDGPGQQHPTVGQDPSLQQTDERGQPPALAVERLRVRREFLYVAEGYSERRRLVVVQARPRQAARAAVGLGFTATVKVGGSVTRNRARRRLREAARLLLPELGIAGVDYVMIARQESATASWPGLLDDMEKALVSLRRRLTADELAPASPAGRLTPPARA